MYNFLVFLVCLRLSSGSETLGLDEGQKCGEGTCTKIVQCAPALVSLRTYREHGLLRCGFDGFEEIVCCPGKTVRSPSESSTVDSTLVWSDGDKKKKPTKGGKGNGSPGNTGRIKTKRKCELMCEKIHKENNVKPEINFHVLNGEDAESGQFPHMAALGYDTPDGTIDWQRCAGSLISPRFVLTASHCVFCVNCADPVKVRFGVSDVTDEINAQDVDVLRLIHADYNITSKHNDISLVELKWEVRTSKTLYPACLYTEANDPAGPLLISGWGQTQQGNADSRSNVLQYANVTAVSTEECNNTIYTRTRYDRKVILSSQICAISKSDTCVGDSGGPLQIKSKLGGYDIVGIVSYGIDCGTPVPGVYTRVSAYLDWIEEKVWPT
ncbi:serine protease persephone-like isoform X2 [Anthonomus grandis grandis]|uniref:serine protease persephone-like isoform X2 n=1 Tax=Anthonomus grandis grandis TaxID=2921223 RepID=UPI0021663C0F|nr:serine protease persephone-like isoform X2 [Anthonomus grandis grandis]